MPGKGLGSPRLAAICRFTAAAQAAAAVALLAAGPALAVTGDKFEYEQTQVGYFPIHPMAMAPDGNGSADVYTLNFYDARLSASVTACFSTGVNLPQGASLAAVQTWFTSGPNSDMSLHLYRTSLATGLTDLLVQELIAEDTGTRTSATFTVEGPLRAVKNATYSYGLGVCIGADTTFRGARVRYTYTNAGD